MTNADKCAAVLQGKRIFHSVKWITECLVRCRYCDFALTREEFLQRSHNDLTYFQYEDSDFIRRYGGGVMLWCDGRSPANTV
jgi:hypothetical protein